MAQFIGGRRVEGSGPEMQILDPFHEETICTLREGTAEDVDRAVAAATAALEEWSALSGAKRAEFLVKIADAVAEAKPELSKIETKNCGKPFPESEWDMDDVVTCFKYYAKLATELDDKQNTPVDVDSADYKCSLRYEAAGVAGLIVPFNYPLLMAVWKVAPALAAGCTAVLKPSELTPLTALELGEICAKVGLPAGVLNVVVGGPETGKALVEHPDVAVVSFTGSVPTGVKVAQASAPLVKGLGLELGGKSTSIVFADSDMKKAVEWVAFGCFWTNGQICSSTSRLIVEESALEGFLDQLIKLAKDIKMGDPMDNDCRLGPLVSAAQRDKVLNFIQKGIADGAELLYGSGKKPTEKGFFVEPTVLRVNSDRNTVWNEEIFGPVLSVMSFKSEEDAIRIANKSKYGLAAAVFTADVSRFARINNKLKVGIVWNNCSQPCFCQLPWGGPKLSGNTTRDLGEFGLKKFLEPKQIVHYVAEGALDWYNTSSL